MNSIAFKVFGITVRWYSIMIVVGILLAMMVSNSEVKKQNIDKEFFINLIFYIIVFGILGARIYYVLFNLNYYLANPIEIIMIWHGGLAIHGGIIAGLIVTLAYCKKYNYNTLKLLDIIVVGVILAQAIGRWGNFFNQEAYGMATTRESLEALHLPNFIIDGMFIDGKYYQPTFLYESIWNLFGFIVLIILRKRKNNKTGQITACYLIWYSIGRIYIEHFRLDSLMLGSIKIAQLISLLLIIVGIILFLFSKKENNANNLNNKGKRIDSFLVK